MKAPFLMIISLFLIISFSSVLANNPLKVRVEGGITSEISVADGYFLGFEMGFPISKVFEFAPGFRMSSTIPNKRLSNSYSIRFDQVGQSYGGSAPSITQYEGTQLFSVDLMLYLKPLGWFQNPKLEQHQLLIGTGIGYKNYTEVFSFYDLSEGTAVLENFGYSSGGSVEPYYLKMIYAKSVGEKVDVGCIFGLNGVDAEAQANYGIILGLRF